MKRFLTILLTTYSFLAISAQVATFTVTGKITGAEGIRFSLQKSENGAMKEIQSAIVIGGTFVMKGGSVQYPEIVYLVSADRKYVLSFFLENSEITITATLQEFNQAKVKGSKTQDDLNSLTESLQPLITRYTTKNNDLQKAQETGNKAMAEKLTNEIKQIAGEAEQVQVDFIRKHPASFATPLILQSNISAISSNELESIINSLDPAVARTPVIVELKSKLAVLKRVEIGQKAPEFTMNDISGKPVSLSSKTGKNILLIDFWAAWCGPCRAENPNVVRTYTEFRDKGFDILGVSLDRTAADWQKGVKDDNLTWTHVSDLKYWNNDAAKLYGVTSIPANFLLDRNGIIIAKNLRGEDLYLKVRELVGKD